MLYRQCMVCALLAACAFFGGQAWLHGADPREMDAFAVPPPEIVDDAKSKTRGVARNYDPLPLTMEEMGEYDRIAMEPYTDRYDSLPLHEKAELYSQQFRFMRARDPVFLPDLNLAIDRSRMGIAESGGADYPEEAEIAQPGEAGHASQGAPEEVLPSHGVFDALPSRIADMGEYERIAMEPYADRYDKLPLYEKAELYSRQFELVNNRAPIFSPELRAAIRRTASEPVQTTRAGRRDIYKEPEDRKKQHKGMDLSRLPGPWEANRKPEEPEGVYIVNPDGTIYQEKDIRMESLRGGWDSRELLRNDR